MMKRYVAFVFHSYEERGGWKDVLEEKGTVNPLSFETIEEAVTAATSFVKDRMNYADSFHVVDLHTGQIVAEE